MPDFDVIGAGPAGEVLAGRTAAACLSTAILEERRPRDLAGALRTAFDHEGSALVEAMVARHELSLPPTITLEQVKGFSLYAARTVLSGRGDELVDLVKTNVTRRLFS